MMMTQIAFILLAVTGAHAAKTANSNGIQHPELADEHQSGMASKQAGKQASKQELPDALASALSGKGGDLILGLSLPSPVAFAEHPLHEYQNPMHESHQGRTAATFNTFFSGLKALQWDYGKLKSPKRILSFGCSVGFEPRHLAARFPDARIFGYDLDENSLKEARKHASGNVQYSSSLKDFDEAADPKQNKFDFVTVNYVLFKHMSKEEFAETMAFWRSLLSEDGMLEIFVYKTLAWTGSAFDSEVLLNFLKAQPAESWRQIPGWNNAVMIAWAPNMAEAIPPLILQYLKNKKPNSK